MNYTSLILITVVALSGCAVNVERTAADPVKTYANCVILAPWEGDVEKVDNVVSQYFEVLTKDEVKTRHLQDETVVFRVLGDRGVFGSSARIFIETYRSRQQLALILDRHGLLYFGFPTAFHVALGALESEAPRFSSKAKTPAAVESQ